MFMTRCNLQEGAPRNSPAPNITLHSYNNNQFSSRLKSRLKPSVYVACAQKKRRKKGDDVTLQVLDPDEPEKSAK